MAEETELERLVVRLIGDATGYLEMLKNSAEASQKAAEDLKKVAEASTTASHGITGLGRSLLHLGEAYLGTHFLESAFEAFQGREQTILKLTAAIESNGMAVRPLIAEYKEFGKEIAEVSLVSAGEVLNLARKAESYKLTGEAAKEAIKNAIALAAVNDGEAESYLRITAAIAKGDTELAMHMSRLVPQLRGITDETEFLAEANRLFATGMHAAAAQANSSEGAIHHLQMTIKGLKGDFGEIVSQAVTPVIRGFGEMAGILRAMPEWMKEVTVAVGFLVAAIGTLLTTTTALRLSLPILQAQLMATFTFIAANPIALWVVGITAAVAAFVALKYAVFNATRAVKDFNQERERSGTLQTQVVSRQRAQTEKTHTQAKEIMEPIKRKEFLEKELETAKLEVTGLSQAVRRASADVEEMDTFWNRWNQDSNKALQQAKAELKDQQELLDGAKDRVKILGDAFADVSEWKQHELLIEDIDALNKKLKEQINTLGLSGEAAEAWKMSINGGGSATLQMLKDVNLNLWLKEQGEEALKTQEEFDHLNETLKDQLATWQMSEDEIKIYKLEQNGLSEANADYLRGLSDLVQQQEEYKKSLEAGEALAKEMQSPMEAYQDRLKELQDLYEDGAISAETWQRAVGKAKEQLDEAAKSGQKANSAVGKFSAVSSRSAEGRSRIQEFRDTLDATLNSPQDKTLEQQKIGNQVLMDIRKNTEEANKKQSLEVEVADLS